MKGDSAIINGLTILCVRYRRDRNLEIVTTNVVMDAPHENVLTLRAIPPMSPRNAPTSLVFGASLLTVKRLLPL